MKWGLAAGVCALGCLAAGCSSGSNVCSPANCTACCSFSGASARGVCVGLDFQSPATCGIGGVVCAACAQGMACSLGSCVPVTVFDAGVDAGPAPLCVADGGGPVRCMSAADCACGDACELGVNVCTSSCFDGQPCNVGCCDSATGSCVSGTQATNCGALGVACSACNADAGLTCEAATGGGVCGCASTADCPQGSACDSTSGTCTAPCGKPGEACCAPEACGDGSFCQAGFCALCGGPGNRCCPDGTCSRVIGLVCESGTCQACGGIGQPCCPGNGCNTPCCLEQVVCVSAGATCPGVDGGTCGINGSCGSCGGAGQPCCTTGTGGSYCSAPGTSCVGDSCQPCGSPGQPCCADTASDACAITIMQACSPAAGAPDASCGGACGISGTPCCPGGECATTTTPVGLCDFAADGGVPMCL